MEKLKCNAAVLYDLTEDKIIKEYNEDEQMDVAGLEEVMTAVVVLDCCSNLDDEFKVSDREGSARYQSLVKGDSLKPGEEVKVKDALEYMLLTSAQEAKDAIQVEFGGSMADFRKLMNFVAKELKMDDTYYSEEGCKSTALDQLKLLRKAIGMEKFIELASKDEGIIGESKHRKKAYEYHNLNEMADFPNEVRVLKRGFKNEAGSSLAAVIRKGDKDYLAILLGGGKEEELLHDMNIFLEEVSEPQVDLDYRDLIKYDKGARKKTREKLRKEFLGEEEAEVREIKAEIGEAAYAEPEEVGYIDENEDLSEYETLLDEDMPEAEVETKHPLREKAAGLIGRRESGSLVLEKEDVIPAAAAVAVGIIAVGLLAVRKNLKK